MRQGSVLGPLLLNILFNSIADAIRTVCPGVSLSTDRSAPVAPRVALLLYADDLRVWLKMLLSFRELQMQ